MLKRKKKQLNDLEGNNRMERIVNPVNRNKIILRLNTFIIIILSILLMNSCSDDLNLKTIGFEKSYQIAKKKFIDEDYVKAIEDLNIIILNYSGSVGIDSAKFLLAKSHFNIEEYYLASYEYKTLVDNFPSSPLAEEALYSSALSYYMVAPDFALDQKDTKTAMTKFQLFLDSYSTGEYAAESIKKIKEIRTKLAQKEFESGELYMRIDEPRAAKVYFLLIIEEYYDTIYYNKSLEKIAEAYKEMKDDYNYQLYLDKYNKTLIKESN